MNIGCNRSLPLGVSRLGVQFARFLMALVVISWVGSLHAATFSDFADDFSTGLSKWTLFGSPRPQWLASAKGRTGIFDNNGDSNYNSGAVSNTLVGGANGFTIQSDVYLDFSNLAGCWDGPMVGLTKYANPVIGDSGQNEEYGLHMALEAVGDACWGNDPGTRRHTYFNMAILADDGTYAAFDSYSLNADSYANGWHTLKIQVNADRSVRFYIDSLLLWTPTKKLDPALLTGRNVILGWRSSGSAGKSYHDSVTVMGAAGSASGSPVYRFFNNNAGGHFYTISEAEKNAVLQNYHWFRYEGIGFNAPAVAQSGMLPVYRFFNNNAGGHFYTINEAEKNAVIQNYNWFRYEGIGFYASPVAQSGMLPLYRFFNNNAGGHFYTISEAEKNTVIQNYSWFRYEGPGFYAYPPDAGAPPASPVSENLIMSLPAPQTQNLTIVTMSDEGTSAAGATHVSVPANVASLVYLTDANDNLAGVGMSRGDGSGVTIDAASTAVGLVMMTPFGWSGYGLTQTQLESKIRAAASFGTLVSRVQAKQQVNASGLTDDEQVISAVMQVAAEAMQSLASASFTPTLREMATSAPTDRPWVEPGPVVRNPRFVPYGVLGIDGNWSSRDVWPWVAPERQFSWQLSRMPVGTTAPTSTAFQGLTQGKLCAVRFVPGDNFFDYLMTVVVPGGPVMTATYETLSGHLQGLGEDQWLYRFAQLRGMGAWQAALYLNALGSIPQTQFAVELMGGAGQFVKTIMVERRVDWNVVTSSTIQAFGELFLHWYKTRADAGSMVRATATYLLDNGTAIRGIGVTVQYVGKFLKGSGQCSAVSC